MLASVVYCVRVLAAEKILPAVERDDQTEEDRERFLDIRKQYLADGSYSLISIMLSLLAYSKHAALNEGNASNAYQLPNKKIFYLSGWLIIIKRFRAIAQSIEAKVENKFQQMCQVNYIANRFTVDLAQIQDNVTFTTQSRSFITTLGNRLLGRLAQMLLRARSTESGMRLQTSNGQQRSKKVREYLRQLDRFLELTLGCVHIKSRQPARGSKIITMQHRNRLLQNRNVFVVDGAIITVVRYYKLQFQQNKPKVVLRFLPPRLEQVIVLYLGYLQPF